MGQPSVAVEPECSFKNWVPCVGGLVGPDPNCKLAEKRGSPSS